MKNEILLYASSYILYEFAYHITKFILEKF